MIIFLIPDYSDKPDHPAILTVNKARIVFVYLLLIDLSPKIFFGTDYSTVKHTYSSPTSNHYNNGKGTITYKYKEKNIQIKFTFKDKKISAFSLSKY